jgi:hypothetical protein
VTVVGGVATAASGGVSGCFGRVVLGNGVSLGLEVARCVASCRGSRVFDGDSARRVEVAVVHNVGVVLSKFGFFGGVVVDVDGRPSSLGILSGEVLSLGPHDVALTRLVFGGNRRLLGLDVGVCMGLVASVVEMLESVEVGVLSRDLIGSTCFGEVSLQGRTAISGTGNWSFGTPRTAVLVY